MLVLFVIILTNCMMIGLQHLVGIGKVFRSMTKTQQSCCCPSEALFKPLVFVSHQSHPLSDLQKGVVQISSQLEMGDVDSKGA